MARRLYPLRRGGPPVVGVSSGGLRRPFSVTHAGSPLGVIPSRRALRQGRTFPLPDGGTLEVRLRLGLLTELQVTRNGQPLPGSESHPAERLKVAARAVALAGVVTFLLGSMGAVTEERLLRDLGLGLESALCGAAALVLLPFVAGASRTALALALGAFSIDTLLACAVPEHPNLGVLMMRALLFVPMVRGFEAIGALRAQARVDRAIESF